MSGRGVFAVDRGIWSESDFADEPFTEREAFMWWARQHGSRTVVEAFWSAYPKTETANPKYEAFKVFDRLAEDDRALAVASLPGFEAWVVFRRSTPSRSRSVAPSRRTSK